MKKFLISSAVSLGLVFGIGLALVGGDEGGGATEGGATSTIQNGRQFIDVVAKGGYAPRIVTARADMPTTLRMTTKNTFDCSAAFTIPDLNYSRFLPQKGTTEIEIPPQKSGKIIRGLCSMGMYGFAMRFE